MVRYGLPVRSSVGVLLMNDFLRFVVERHRIWEKRQAGAPQPWTDDPILATRKFTNVFRVLDPGTQFVLTDLLDPELDPRDQLMRLFLYRHTGRVEAWQWLQLSCGYPTVATLEEVRASWKDYQGRVRIVQKPRRWSKIVSDSRITERSIYTNAYQVFVPSDVSGTDKLDIILGTTKRLFTPGSPDYLMPAWQRARTQAERFRLLRKVNGVGDFMSMQILTDWGYGQSVDREDEFLVPGPGSVKGAAALMPGVPTTKVVNEVVLQVRAMPQCPRLGYRVPSLMDIGSNLLCEWSKYVRYRGQPVSAKNYRPAHPGLQSDPVLPAYYAEDLI